MNKPAVAGYVRVSTEDQAKDDKTSLQTQKKAIADFAKSHDWTIHKIYEDHESGAKEDRTQYLEMKKDGAEKKFSKILFLDWTRFARNSRETLNAHHEFRESGISLVCLHGGVDTSTPEGELFMQQMSGFSQYEREHIRRRMLAGKVSKAARGEICPIPRMPYGYAWDKEKKKIVLNPKEAETVKKIFDYYLKKRYSFHELADRLNKEGHRTSKGGLWWNSSLRFILRNSHYTGRLVFQSRNNSFSPVVYDCPPLITHAEHQRILDLIADNTDKALTPPNVRDDDPFTLRGMLTCGECGSRMVALTEKGKNRIYICYWTQPKVLKRMVNQNKKRCTMPRQSAEKLEENILINIKFFSTSRTQVLKALKKEKASSGSFEKQAIQIQKRISQEEDKKSRLYDLFGESAIDKKELLAKIDEINLKLSQMKDEKEELDKKVNLTKGKNQEIEKFLKDSKSHRGYAVENVFKVLDKMSPKEKKEFLRRVIEGRLTVRKDGHLTGTYSIAKAYDWLADFSSGRS